MVNAIRFRGRGYNLQRFLEEPALGRSCCCRPGQPARSPGRAAVCVGGSRREVRRHRRGDLQDFQPRRRGHFVAHIDDPPGPQMGIEGHLDHRLPVGRPCGCHAGRFVSLLRIGASWRCMPDRPRPTRPKVTSRTMRRQPRSPGRVRLRIGARAGSAQVLGGGASGWRGQAGSGNGRSGAEGRRGGPGGVAAAACRPGGGAGQRSPDGGRGEYPRGVPGWCGRIRSRRNSSRSYISSSGDRRSIVAPVAG